MLLVDACRDDPMTPGARSVGGGQSFVDFKEAEGHSILFGTKFGGKSYEYSELGHGLFSYCVLKGLQGEAASGEGNVTFRFQGERIWLKGHVG